MLKLKIKPLGLEASRLTSVFSQGMGFVFHLRGKRSKLFEFPQENQIGIHMLFVFFPLIVVWMDKQKKITHTNVSYPFISFTSHKAKYVLEIPYKTEVLKKIRVGMKLSW